MFSDIYQTIFSWHAYKWIISSISEIEHVSDRHFVAIFILNVSFVSFFFFLEEKYPGVYFKNIFEKIKSLTIECYLFFTIISHRMMRQLYVCGYIFIFVVKYTTVVKDFLSLLGALKICCFQCHCTITFSRSHHIPIKGEVEEPFIYHLMGSYT